MKCRLQKQPDGLQVLSLSSQRLPRLTWPHSRFDALFLIQALIQLAGKLIDIKSLDRLIEKQKCMHTVWSSVSPEPRVIPDVPESSPGASGWFLQMSEGALVSGDPATPSPPCAGSTSCIKRKKSLACLDGTGTFCARSSVSLASLASSG